MVVSTSRRTSNRFDRTSSSGRGVTESPRPGSVAARPRTLRVVGVHVDMMGASQLQRQGGGGVKRWWLRVQEGSQLPCHRGGGVKRWSRRVHEGSEKTG
jgi:hypothetical protein